ncbi:MAG: serine/threonine protein kinase [Gammaproteobacteria bacterium]|nr:serine/threonine protein kinase [Gammaproteobacteria bacterium]
MADERNPLADGSQIDCYEIIKPIAGGGFSLIYLAKDLDDQSRVVIKEYLPKKLSRREKGASQVRIISEEKRHSFNQGRKLFYKEAKVLSQLKHPNIVNVRNFFLANDTAYMVMDYEEGKNLGGYIRKRGGGLSTSFMMTVFPPVLDALALVHDNNHLHLDIKPSNIHLRSGGNPLLLDFGAAHEFLERAQIRTGRVVTPGYSPVEQYYSTGALGPWSDVYAMGASMRTCLDGKSPPTAIERHANDNLKPAAVIYRKRYPAHLLQAIDWAMAIDAPDRPRNARELLQAFIGSIPVPRDWVRSEELDQSDDPESL